MHRAGDVLGLSRFNGASLDARLNGDATEISHSLRIALFERQELGVPVSIFLM